jgi:hypothetical protein
MCGAVDLWRVDVRTVDVVSGLSVGGTLPFKLICRIFSYVENISGSTNFYTAPIIRCWINTFIFLFRKKLIFIFYLSASFRMGSVQKTMKIKSQFFITYP